MGWTGELLNVKQRIFLIFEWWFSSEIIGIFYLKFIEFFPLIQLLTWNIQISPPRCLPTREIVDFAHRAPETPPTIPKLVSDSEIYYFRMRKQVPRAYRRVRIYDFQQALPVTMAIASVGDFGRLLSLWRERLNILQGTLFCGDSRKILWHKLPNIHKSMAGRDFSKKEEKQKTDSNYFILEMSSRAVPRASLRALWHVEDHLISSLRH